MRTEGTEEFRKLSTTTLSESDILDLCEEIKIQMGVSSDVESGFLFKIS